MSKLDFTYASCPKDPTIYSFIKFFNIAPENYAWCEEQHYDLVSGDYYAIPAAKRFLEACNDKAKIRFLVYTDMLRRAELLSPKAFGFVLEKVWTTVGLSSWRPKPSYVEAESFFHKVAFKDILHCDENEKFFNSLPAQITVYRGTNHVSWKKAKNGMSWTTDYDEAYSFARKSGSNAPNSFCLKGTIEKTKILAAYNKGKEIVVPSKGVSWITNEPLITLEDLLFGEQESIAA